MGTVQNTLYSLFSFSDNPMDKFYYCSFYGKLRAYRSPYNMSPFYLRFYIYIYIHAYTHIDIDIIFYIESIFYAISSNSDMCVCICIHTHTEIYTLYRDGFQVNPIGAMFGNQFLGHYFRCQKPPKFKCKISLCVKIQKSYPRSKNSSRWHPATLEEEEERKKLKLANELYHSKMYCEN